MESFLPVIFILIMLVVGLIYCFFGYRYFKIVIVIFALLGGAYFVNSTLLSFAPQLSEWAWLISLAAGIVLALLAFFFVKFAIFIAGGIIGLMIHNIIKSAAPEAFASLEGVAAFLVGLAFFLVMGFITLALKKHIIILFSAISGSYVSVYCGGILIGLIKSPGIIAEATMQNATTALAPASIFAGKPIWYMLIPVIVLLILGIISQYKTSVQKH